MINIANLHIINVTATGADFYIDGLGGLWDTSNYQNAGVSSSPVADGSSSIDGMGFVYPPSPPGSGYSTGIGSLFTTLTPNTNYTVYGAARAANGLFYAAGSASFKTLASSRPPSFAWTYPKVQGNDFNLTAAEWNALATNVNSVRAYKSLFPYGFTTAYTGVDVQAFYYRQAVNAINDMTPPTTVPPLRYTDEDILAADLNRLVSSINSIS